MFTTRFTRWPLAVLAATSLQLAACSGDDGSSGVTDAAARGPGGFGSAYPAPPSLVTVPVGGADLRFWPFTANNLNGDPATRSTWSSRASRIPSPSVARSWRSTAIGAPSACPTSRRSTAPGPTPSATCRPPGPSRPAGRGARSSWPAATTPRCGFHLRLFDVGSHLVGNAHFEVLIPGTADHQVLSWELAEQLVTVDLMRTGLLDASAPVTPTAQINPAPTWRTIPAIIYNGLPVELRGLIGGPLGDQSRRRRHRHQRERHAVQHRRALHTVR